MDETILFPSPNWFLSSVLAVTSDGWLVYGGPSKSLCVLEPLPPNSKRVVSGQQGYRAHVAKSAHGEKITCVDVSPEWPTKRLLMTGSTDGMVKQWSLEGAHPIRIKCSLSHDLHKSDKEEVVGVGYLDNGFAVTVGSFGSIVKWDLTSNVMKTYKNVLKNFKPTCMACSPHRNLFVAIGTKQGVVFVLDLNGASRVVYKVRAQDDEIVKISWCPKSEVIMKKALAEIQRKSNATKRMEKIRQEPESEEVLKELDERVKLSASVEHFMKDKSARIDEESQEGPSGSKTEAKQDPNESGTIKTLPDDSFDETVVQEDDMFDIYKDHEADEFGHKKYVPEEILVKVKEDSEVVDYLTECQKLKEDILKNKNDPEPSIEALVDALDNAHVDDTLKTTDDQNVTASEAVSNKNEEVQISEVVSDKNEAETAEEIAGDGVTSCHVQRELLASVSKHGSIKIFSKNGKLVASCQIPSFGGGHNQKQRNKNANAWTTILWYKPDLLLIGDGKNNMLQCNPLKIDCKNKLEYSTVHSLHKRGLFCIASNAPRCQPDDMDDKSSDWVIWTTSQDRYLIKYSMEKNNVVSCYNTCGGFVYFVQPCPYDANRLAISVGDGAVRVWATESPEDDETKLTLGKVDSLWQNVQGKVLVAAWHPTKEFRLAFATGENRIGILDTSKPEKPARLLLPVLSGGVYSMCWGEDNALYACGGGEMVIYNAEKTDEAPSPVVLEHEGQKVAVSAVRFHAGAPVIGTNGGAVAILTSTVPHAVVAAVFVFSKMIHTVEWHPQETSTATEESQYKNLVAVCSAERSSNIVIIEYVEKEDGGKELRVWKTLKGHTGLVNQVTWNPHIEARLLSTAQDGTVRIWDAAEGLCLSILGSHGGAALGACWSPHPHLSTTVVSGGTDCCLRLWDYTHYPADQFQEIKHEVNLSKKDKKKKTKTAESSKPDDDEEDDPDNKMATLSENSAKSSKKFLLPIIYKQTNPCPVSAPRRMLKKHLESSGDNVGVDIPDATVEHGLDFLKIFGSTNDVNEILSDELERHQDTGTLESLMMLHIFRGHIDAMVQFAAQRNCLDSYLLSITPCVSLKYWKDATQLYLAQIDRLVAKGEEQKLSESKWYGGAVYRKAASLLSVHDVVGAIKVLTDANLYKEAYVLCRTRYVDSVAQEVLQKWAYYCMQTGNFNMAAVCFIVLGELSHAAKVLGNSKEEDSLSLAADMAKVLGQLTYAQHIVKKRDEIITNKEIAQEKKECENLEELPSRAELLVNEIDDTPDDINDETESDIAKKVIGDTTKEVEVPTEQNEKDGSGDTAKVLEELPAKMEKLTTESESPVIEELPAKMKKLTAESESPVKSEGSSEKETEKSATVNAMAGITDEGVTDCKEYL